MYIYSISEINLLSKKTLEENIGYISIEGEISRTTLHSSGHFYFTLKDNKSSLDAVIFKFHLNQTLVPKTGEKWIFEGNISIWDKAGRYMFKAIKYYPSGKGNILLQFLMLKKKLNEEGLFDNKFKKTLPQYPQKVGIITSPTGAAIRDILNIYKRRFNNCEIIISPSMVQGVEAQEQLIQAFNKLLVFNPEVIIITRGGGSIEDMVAFNSEKLSRIVFSSTIPVVSAIGHEIDQTILDFVADISAPTPSTAAELVFPDKKIIIEELTKKKLKIKKECFYILDFYKKNIKEIKTSYTIKSIPGKIENYGITLDYLSNNLKKRFLGIISNNKNNFDLLKNKVSSKRLYFSLNDLRRKIKSNYHILENFRKSKISNKEEKLIMLKNFIKSINLNNKLLENKKILKRNKKILEQNIINNFNYSQNRLSNYKELIYNLSPERALKRGYTIVSDDQNKVIKRAENFKAQKKYNLNFYDNIIMIKKTDN